MKKLIYGFLAVGLMACGGESENESEDAVDSVADTTFGEIEMTDEMPVEEVYMPENSDGNWQIDDYAEMFLEDKIAANSEEANMENSVGWFYQELDLTGGFASVTGAIEGWCEYVIWRMEDGDDLIGTMSVGCGPACDYAFKFYKGLGKDVEEIDISKIMPIAEIEEHKKMMHDKVLNDDKLGGFDYPEDAQLFFRFPQKGTSMEVDLIVGADEMQTTILLLSWDKTKFSIKKKFTEIKEII